MLTRDVWRRDLAPMEAKAAPNIDTPAIPPSSRMRHDVMVPHLSTQDVHLMWTPVYILAVTFIPCQHLHDPQLRNTS